ncbi:MAG TPA: hypothetical protein VFF06_28405 [Polyangia bacterium]|nr:hypothetical protein [Polyangia bacterium]
MTRAIALLALCAGCQVVRTIGTDVDGGGVDLVESWIDVKLTRNKVDLLFMVDNSPSMSPKQAELKVRFPQLMQKLDAFGATTPIDYHIGVVTSDLGAGPFNINSGQCHPGGDGGKLQAKGAAADPNCGALGNGVSFIEYDQIHRDAAGQPRTNLPAGEDLPTAFGCAASVGDVGCGFEHQLESVYRALHDPIPENAGFLRDDALLAVVWLTDEDDCSADPNTDLFDPSPAGVSKYGALLSYRCTNYGIECDAPGTATGPLSLMPYGDSGGPLAGCVPATQADGGKLLDVSRYISFFTQPKANGGVKIDPNDVVLVGISAPEAPVQSILANIKTGAGAYQACPGPIDPSGSGCAAVLQHSCVSPANTAFFGDPAVRLRAVIDATPNPANRQNTSVCDTNYTASLDGLGSLITAQLVGGCLPGLADPSHVECLIEDVTINSDGTTTVATIPECVTAGDPLPCWRASVSPPCGGSQLTIDRPAAGPPPNTTVNARCRATS